MKDRREDDEEERKEGIGMRRGIWEQMIGRNRSEENINKERKGRRGEEDCKGRKERRGEKEEGMRGGNRTEEEKN